MTAKTSPIAKTKSLTVKTKSLTVKKSPRTKMAMVTRRKRRRRRRRGTKNMAGLLAVMKYVTCSLF